jgi:DNA-binding GntR family transcriptional regulator
LPRTPLSERAHDQIRGRILRGEWPAGTVLGEGSLAGELGMSKTPVRQALRLLLQQGLLEVGPHRQMLVRDLSAEHRAEVLEIRRALEQIAVSHACRRMPPEQVDQLQVLLRRQARAADAGDEDAFVELDEAFHVAVARGAGMPTVAELLVQMRGFVRLMQLGRVREPAALRQVIQEHRELVEAIEARDEARALAVLVRHLDTWAPQLDP